MKERKDPKKYEDYLISVVLLVVFFIAPFLFFPEFIKEAIGIGIFFFIGRKVFGWSRKRSKKEYNIEEEKEETKGLSQLRVEFMELEKKLKEEHYIEEEKEEEKEEEQELSPPELKREKRLERIRIIIAFAVIFGFGVVAIIYTIYIL